MIINDEIMEKFNRGRYAPIEAKRCMVCEEMRSPTYIGTISHDMSFLFGSPKQSIIKDILYCKDRVYCFDVAHVLDAWK